MRIAIVGGGAAGLFAALLLARAGHEVTVVEQEPFQPAADPESAAAMAYRPTAPQIVQPHIVMARCRELLRQHLPDVYGALLSAGVAEAPLSTRMPASMSDHSVWPGDELLTTLMTRRSTLDWVVQRAVVAERGVTVRGRTRVRGLLAVGGRPPHVTGVRTDQGDVRADLVVDTTGRRSPIDRWLEQIGAQPGATQWAECGVAYTSRHYRLRPGADLPDLPTTRMVFGLDEFTIGIFGADRGAMQLVVAPLATDRRFRTIKDPDVFTAVLRTVPAFVPWLDVLDPIGPIYQMAGLHNTLRRLVNGRAPVVTGLHAIGDSVCTTNPTLGRGLSLALWGAADLATTLTRHEDRTEQALAMDEQVSDHVAPFYDDQAVIDRARLEALRHKILGAPAPAPPSPGLVTYAQLRTAAAFDPTAFRAFWKIQAMMCRPEEIYRHPDVVARTQESLRTHGTGPPVGQPTTDELLAALAT